MFYLVDTCAGATFSNETPAEVTDRPTEVSITKTEFTWPRPVLKGDESLPIRIAPGSERYTGEFFSGRDGNSIFRYE